MNYFLFTTIVAGGAFQKTEARAGLIYETSRGLYEIYINAHGDEFFFFNMRPIKGLPVDEKHIKDTEKLINKFNHFKDEFQKYCLTRDNNLWWKLKQQISPNPSYH